MSFHSILRASWSMAGVGALVLFVACGSQDIDRLVGTGPVELGKADAVQRVPGTSIASQYVDPARFYLSHRNIKSLEQVGALTGEMESVVRRVDGIVASLPADDIISVSEMERMEQPAYLATLFAAEKAAFVLLWSLLEIPDQTPAVLTASALDLAVTNTSATPTPLTFPAVEPIDSLPERLQETARRLQLVFDSDGDQDTISFTDLDEGADDPLGRFTLADIELFGAIHTEIYSRGTTEAEARVDVPPPGEFEVKLTLGDLTLLVNQRVRYEETRGFYRDSTHLHHDLKMFHAVTVTMELPDNVTALLLDEATGEEQVFDDGQQISQLPASIYIMELWQDGQRISSARAQIAEPGVSQGGGIENLEQYIDHNLYTSSGNKLARNPVSTERFFDYYSASYSHDLLQEPYDPALVDEYVLQKIELLTHKIPLPAGRYRRCRCVGTITYDIYPQGVIYATRDGECRLMEYLTNEDYEVTFDRYLHRINFVTSEAEEDCGFTDQGVFMDIALSTDDRI